MSTPPAIEFLDWADAQLDLPGGGTSGHRAVSDNSSVTTGKPQLTTPCSEVT